MPETVPDQQKTQSNPFSTLPVIFVIIILLSLISSLLLAGMGN